MGKQQEKHKTSKHSTGESQSSFAGGGVHKQLAKYGLSTTKLAIIFIAILLTATGYAIYSRQEAVIAPPEANEAVARTDTDILMDAEVPEGVDSITLAGHYNTIANSLVQQQKYQEAIEYYQKVEAIEQADRSTYLNIAELYRKLNKQSEANEYDQKAAEARSEAESPAADAQSCGGPTDDC